MTGFVLSYYGTERKSAMPAHTIHLAPHVYATVSDPVAGKQPWGGRDAFEYTVTVTAGAHRFTEEAWGSQHDYEQGVQDHDGIGWMILREVYSAYCDPDEFFSMATDDGDGKSSLEKARGVLSFIDFAEKAGPIIEPYADQIEENDC